MLTSIRHMLFIVLQFAAGAVLAGQLAIPPTHPRLWFNDAARLAAARAWLATHPVTPGGSDAHYEHALLCALNGTPANCTAARNWLMGFTANNVDYGANDPLRWEGENAMLVYDWCHAALSAADRQTLITRWNGYITAQNLQADSTSNTRRWGGLGMEANNYFHGQMRNSLLWGIVSYGENPQAPAFVAHALDVRFGNWFERWTNDFGSGGTLAEGSAYGSVMLSYPLIAFTAAADYGIDPFLATRFYRDAIYQLVYATTIAPTRRSNEAVARHHVFPANDDEVFAGGGTLATREYFGDFMRYMTVYYPSTPYAGYARSWLASTNAPVSWLMAALPAASGPTIPIANLPLDYYAPGSGVFDMRSGHDAAATQVHLQLGWPGGVGHLHDDLGTFQLARRGRWISRESTGYSQTILGWGNHGAVDVGAAEGHNGLMFEGYAGGRWSAWGGPTVFPSGADRRDNADGLPIVLRIQHAPQFAFAAVELRDAYRSTSSDVARAFDWPYVDSATREFIFVRPLEALVILDRIRASDDSLLPFYGTAGWRYRAADGLRDGRRLAAADVTRTFVAHFEQPPVVVGNRLSAPLVSQTADLIRLLPVDGVVRVVAEGGAAGQHRVEIDHRGSAETYFLNVVYGRDNDELPIDAQLVESSDQWVLTLTHPTRGTATVTLARGLASQGGSVRVGGGTPLPLAPAIGSPGLFPYRIDDAGPQWGPSDFQFADGFESP